MDISLRARSCAFRKRWCVLVLCGVALSSVPARADNIPPHERIVSWNGVQKSRRAVLEDVCRQAGLSLKVDEEALAEAGLNLDELVSVRIDREALQEVLRQLIDWRAYLGVCQEIRGDTLVLTTLPAMQERTQRQLPEWLKPLYNRGLIARVDDTGAVTTINAGEVVTDELLAKIASLPRLRELHLETTKTLTKAGLAHLARMPALEILQLYSVNTEGDGPGDTAIEVASRIATLRELSISECGTTDAGVRHLEAMPQLTHLTLQDGRLTDVALASVAKLKTLRHLDLTSYVATRANGRMQFTPEGLLPLKGLRVLEVLWLAGHAPSASLFPFPKLTSVVVGEVDDSVVKTIALCRGLQHLELGSSAITDDGLRPIVTLHELRRLSLRCPGLTDAGMVRLHILRKLEHVELSAGRFGDETLKSLAEIKTLARLDLRGNGGAAGSRFTAEGMRQLKVLPRLRTLWLTDFPLEGGFGTLKELTQLRDLTLMMTGINAREFDALEDALPNTQVNVVTGAGSFLSKQRRAARLKQ